jgi:hypothetical protein
MPRLPHDLHFPCSDGVLGGCGVMGSRSRVCRSDALSQVRLRNTRTRRACRPPSRPARLVRHHRGRHHRRHTSHRHPNHPTASKRPHHHQSRQPQAHGDRRSTRRRLRMMHQLRRRQHLNPCSSRRKRSRGGQQHAYDLARIPPLRGRSSRRLSYDADLSTPCGRRD